MSNNFRRETTLFKAMHDLNEVQQKHYVKNSAQWHTIQVAKYHVHGLASDEQEMLMEAYLLGRDDAIKDFVPNNLKLHLKSKFKGPEPTIS